MLHLAAMLCDFFFSSRRRHTRCALVTGVQTCALPIWVKNTLAIVQAMAQQTFKGDARLRAASEVFQGRLSALSTEHNILVRDRWSPASLTQIVRDVVKHHSGADEGVRIEGPDVNIPPKTAITLAEVGRTSCRERGCQ